MNHSHSFIEDNIMKRIRLDGKKMTDRRSTHEYIAKKLGFPEYYGNNLDALHDCLCEIGEETTVTLINAEEFAENLGAFHKGFIRVFEDSAGENANLTFKCKIKA